jgi:hypothetical protein
MRLISSVFATALLLTVAMPAAPGPGHAGGLMAPAATDFSSAKKKPRHGRAMRPRYPHGPGTIACTRAGCSTVPLGCHAINERTVDDSPSGFQIIVC